MLKNRGSGPASPMQSPTPRSPNGRSRNAANGGGAVGGKSSSSVANRKAPLFAYYSLTAVCLLFVLIRQAPELFVLSDMASLKYINEQLPLGSLGTPLPAAKVYYNETYTPKLLNADDFVKFDGIHIVRSRYQQGQPDLVTLGKARLELFKDFCLPSMVHQTTNNFVWLIYTDPKLNKELLKEMVDLLAPYPNFYLIASMVNVLWKDGQAQNLTESTVYTGNRTFLEQTMAKRDIVPILETRLDADDALHVRYLEDIQKEAADFFYRQGVRWMYWCIEEELQWYWAGHKGVTEQQRRSGLTLSRTNKDFCPTPGLTLGYNVGTEVASIYRRKHSILIERIRKKEEDLCGVGRPGKDCLQIIRRYPYPAMRTRTPTSSSMIMEELTHDQLVQLSQRNISEFELLANDFGIDKKLCNRTVEYLDNNVLCLARAALKGLNAGIFQVPDGATERLEKLIKELQEEKYSEDRCVGIKNAAEGAAVI